MTQARLTIQHRPIDTLQLDAAKRRQPSQKQIAQIAESIRAFGFNFPVLSDDDNKIIAGRVLACKLLCITEIPAIWLNHLSAEQVRAFVIADNRSCRRGPTYRELDYRTDLLRRSVD
jgi:ParB-like chromosome segregation protein Spo0J